MPQTDVIRRSEPPPLADYATARSSFTWETVAADLGTDMALLNLGGLATERQVGAGRGSEHALVWLSANGATERLTYAELSEASARVANVLAAHGVERGDRVLFLLSVVPELWTGVLGALRAGAVVGVLGSGRNLDYLRNILLRTKPRAFVTVPSFRKTLASLRARVPELKNVFYVNRSKLGMPALGEGERSWSEHIEAAPSSFLSVATSPADRAFLHYTDLGMSGSVVSHLAALPLYHTARSVLEMRPGESAVSIAMPGEHYFVSYSILAPLLAGATSIVLEDPARCQRYADIAADYQPRSWFSGFKAIDVMLRVDPNLGTLLRGCRNITCAWPYDRWFISMTQMSYGSPVHAAWTDREFAALQCAELRGTAIRPGSVGRAVPGADVRVVDHRGEPQGGGGPGKLAVKLGASAPFAGYLDDAAGPQAGDGWFVTSHTARVDADGYVWIES